MNQLKKECLLFTTVIRVSLRFHFVEDELEYSTDYLRYFDGLKTLIFAEVTGLSAIFADCPILFLVCSGVGLAFWLMIIRLHLIWLPAAVCLINGIQNHHTLSPCQYLQHKDLGQGLPTFLKPRATFLLLSHVKAYQFYTLLQNNSLYTPMVIIHKLQNR